MKLVTRGFQVHDPAGLERLNERLQARNVRYPVYPEEPPPPARASDPIRERLFVAVEGGEVRGTVWLQEHEFWLSAAGSSPVGPNTRWRRASLTRSTTRCQRAWSSGSCGRAAASDGAGPGRAWRCVRASPSRDGLSGHNRPVPAPLGTSRARAAAVAVRGAFAASPRPEGCSRLHWPRRGQESPHAREALSSHVRRLTRLRVTRNKADAGWICTFRVGTRHAAGDEHFGRLAVALLADCLSTSIAATATVHDGPSASA